VKNKDFFICLFGVRRFYFYIFLKKGIGWGSQTGSRFRCFPRGENFTAIRSLEGAVYKPSLSFSFEEKGEKIECTPFLHRRHQLQYFNCCNNKALGF
jgi:hypothetical protein